MKIILTAVIAALLLGLCIVLLGVKVLFVKGGKFPSGHVHDNPALRQRGLSCHRGDDRSTRDLPKR